MPNWLSAVLIILVLVAIVALLVVRAIVQMSTYPAPRAPLSLSGLPRDARFVSVETSDGLTLKGIEVPSRGDRPVLLVFHGNGDSAAGIIDWLTPLIAQGYGVVGAEYRGYSANPGSPSASGLAADAAAFHAHARTLAAGRPVLVIGHSLGGAVAFELARTQKLDALVTIGTFATLRDMAPRKVRWLVPNVYRNLAIVPQLDEPYFLVHGLHDETIPFANGAALIQAAQRSGRTGAAFVLDHAGHAPPSSTIAAIITQIDRWRAAGTITPAVLPGMRIVPFHDG